MHPDASTRRRSDRRVPRVCEVCRAPFMARADYVRKGQGRFCGPTCRNVFISRGNVVPLAERFWRHVDKTDACWLWTGWFNGSGYGAIRNPQTDRRPLLATHVAWELVAGVIPDETPLVLHVCDTPACVRNDGVGVYEVNGVLRPRRGHLFLGTTSDNSVDMVAKGRARPPRGERHPMAKLTAAMVAEIRRRGAVHDIPRADLARLYGIHVAHLYAILRRAKRASEE